MPRIVRGLRGGFRRGVVGCVAVAALLGAGGCSGTVEVAYRPPPPPPPSPPPVVVTTTPTPAPTTAPAVAACGPDQISVELGGVQADATSRAVPLLIRSRGTAPCAVANPVGITLLDPAGTALTTHVQTTELPAGRTAVDSVPAATPAAPAPPAAPTAAAPSPAAPAAADPAQPGATGVMLWLQWRAEPSVRTTDPATDCVDATSFLLTLSGSAPPIPVAAKLRACDGGTVYVSPAEANAG